MRAMRARQSLSALHRGFGSHLRTARRVMSFSHALLGALTVFFSTLGMWSLSRTYFRVLREMGVRGWVQWIDIPWLCILCVISGMLMMAIPRFVQTGMLYFVMWSLLGEGLITEDQAKVYLRTKGVKLWPWI